MWLVVQQFSYVNDQVSFLDMLIDTLLPYVQYVTIPECAMRYELAKLAIWSMRHLNILQRTISNDSCLSHPPQ